MTWDAFARRYSSACVIVVNACLGMLLLLALLDRVSAYVEEKRPAPVYSREFKPGSFKLTPPDSVRQTFQEFDRMGAAENFAFVPWTTCMHGEFRGRHVNVARFNRIYNYRMGVEPGAQPAAGPELVVWAFGGSTMFGWGVPDDQTVASWLQRELSGRLPGRRLRVINFGQGYYFSSLEVAQYLSLLRTADRPTAAVFLDGHNDVYNLRGGWEVPPSWVFVADAWERERRLRSDRGAPWLQLTAAFPVFKLARYLALTKGGKGPAVEAPYAQKPQDPVAHIVETYRFNRDVIAAASASARVQAHFFLQPVSFFDAEDEPARRAARDSNDVPYLAYQALVEEASASPRDPFHTLHDALRGVPDPRVDSVHYSDASSRRIASRMADSLAPALAR